MLKPLHPWHLAPGNEERINESISENFCLDSHHSENTGNGMPPNYQHNRKGEIKTRRKLMNFLRFKINKIFVSSSWTNST